MKNRRIKQFNHYIVHKIIYLLDGYVSIKVVEKTSQAVFMFNVGVGLILAYDNLWHLDWLISPKKFIQPVFRLLQTVMVH